MTVITRRTMLVGSGILIAGLATDGLHSQVAPPTKLPKPSQIAPVNAPSTITITDKNEPGEPFVVTGTVTGASGPISGASIFVYHTDAKGLYDPASSPGGGNPRLFGYMRSDAHGHYKFTTIRPAAYPGLGIAAHIHFIVNMPGYDLGYLEPQFEGDHLVFQSHDGKVFVRSPHNSRFTKDSKGNWHLMYDINLRPLVSSTTSPAG